jgi:hypothetical protein
MYAVTELSQQNQGFEGYAIAPQAESFAVKRRFMNTNMHPRAMTESRYLFDVFGNPNLRHVAVGYGTFPNIHLSFTLRF